MVLSEIDRHLLERCLERKPRAWEDFVDRFLGLVIHVINHTAESRRLRMTPELRDDLCSEVFLTLLKDDFAVLRKFRGRCSLASYLCVVARRVVVRALQKRKIAGTHETASRAEPPASSKVPSPVAWPEEDRIANRDEAERLLQMLDGQEATVVRLYHLEGKSYQEISQITGIPANSIGPILSRARSKLRRIATA
ncbi:sigma-70 family RNA polymerase sigma factor [Thermogutta sp.]|uniref:RNA polymerase sigma factor n=1 Tax=Thermogutta sp. TaxID=1962930 RepID=UPI00321F64F0